MTRSSNRAGCESQGTDSDAVKGVTRRHLLDLQTYRLEFESFFAAPDQLDL